MDENLIVITKKGKFSIKKHTYDCGDEVEHVLMIMDQKNGYDIAGKLYYVVNNDEHFVYLFYIVVDACYENKGYGSALLMALEYECAKLKDINKVTGTFAPYNEEYAKGFYGKNGYKIVECEDALETDLKTGESIFKRNIEKYVPHGIKYFAGKVFEIDAKQERQI